MCNLLTSLVSKLKTLFQHLHYILIWDDESCKKKLFWTYLRIKFKYFFLVSLLKLKIHNEKIFGFKVNFFNYGFFIPLFEEIFIRRIYYFKTNNPSPNIIDCGSNIGMTLIYFKWLYPDCKILAFEADEKNCELSSQNIKINDLKDIEIVNKALHNKEGEVAFYYNPDDLVGSLIKERQSKAVKTVQATVLSKYINSEIDFLKMDIEGAEDSVVKELCTSNKLAFIKELGMEYHHHIIPEEDKLSSMLRLFEENSFGYQFKSIPIDVDKEQFQDLLLYLYRK